MHGCVVGGLRGWRDEQRSKEFGSGQSRAVLPPCPTHLKDLTSRHGFEAPAGSPNPVPHPSMRSGAEHRPVPTMLPGGAARAPKPPPPRPAGPALPIHTSPKHPMPSFSSRLMDSRAISQASLANPKVWGFIAGHGRVSRWHNPSLYSAGAQGRGEAAGGCDGMKAACTPSGGSTGRGRKRKTTRDPPPGLVLSLCSWPHPGYGVIWDIYLWGALGVP